MCMVRQDEHRCMERWFVAPPSLPFVVLPGPPLWAEFVAPHDLSADVVGEVASAIVVEAIGSAGVRPDRPMRGGTRPEEERSGVGVAEWAIEALPLPRPITIAGDGEVLNADQLRHRDPFWLHYAIGP